MRPRPGFAIDKKQPVGCFLETVVRHFVPYSQRCYSETGKSHRQSHNANKCMSLVFPQITERHFKIMSYHFLIVHEGF
jgi:hypothetical protein